MTDDAIKIKIDTLLNERMSSTAKLDAFSTMITEMINAVNGEGLQLLVKKMVAAEDPSMSRQVLDSFRTQLGEALEDEGLLTMLNFALTAIGERLSHFRAVETHLRHDIASVYESLGKHDDSANVLCGLNAEDAFNACFPKGAENQRAHFCVSHYVRIAQQLLLGDHVQEADTQIGKCRQYISRLTDTGFPVAANSYAENEVASFVLKSRYTLLQAQLSDRSRHFAKAAKKYYDLFQINFRGDAEDTSSSEKEVMSVISKEHLSRLLQDAVACTILSDPGKPRQRMLQKLYEDERTHTVPHFTVLEKMAVGRLLRRAEVAAFESDLQEHQRLFHDGLSVLMRSVIKHNILAASKIYSNVRLSELAKLLEISLKQAEKIAANMIASGKLNATIDQMDGFLEFGTHNEDGVEVMKCFDSEIRAVCLSLNGMCDRISAENNANTHNTGSGKVK
eukprot:g4267.t1